MSVEQAQAGPTQTADQRSIWVIFSGLMLALLIASLDQTVVATALPTIVSDLGGLSQLSWVVTGYLLASTVSTPLWGKLGDLYGRKRIFQAAIVIFLVGSALCGLSQNMTELILFRSLQGLGGGGLIVLVQAIIGDIVLPRERGRYQGLVMQVLVIAVQNAVDYRNLGSATSGVTFFRSIGGSFGTAIFGAIFSNQLASHLSSLASSLPSGFTLSNAESVAAIQHLPAAVRAEVVHAYAQSLSTVFLVAVPIAAVAFILSCLLPEVRLRTTTQATDVGHTFAMPTARSSQEEIERALHVLASRDSVFQIYRRLAARAGVDLDPLSCWLLFRLQDQTSLSQESLAQRFHVPADRLTPSIESLLQKKLVTLTAQAGDQLQLTAAGQQTLDRLTTASHDSLAELLDGWTPEQEAELATLLRRVAADLFSEQSSKELVSASA